MVSGYTLKTFPNAFIPQQPQLKGNNQQTSNIHVQTRNRDCTLRFSEKQKFQHFLKNFGNEFLINIYLEDELLNYKDRNPLDWLIQLNKT